LTPFLKWPGGKRWLVPFFLELVGGLEYRRYVEPFLGGGAVFFGLEPPRAFLSDVNPDLINVYLQVRADPSQLVRWLKRLPVDDETYFRLRGATPMASIESAVRFLYLNRTAFGGMYRLNRRGEFNVPFGGGQRTPRLLWKRRLLQEASRALTGAVIEVADFEETLDRTGSGDLVYCDPTYTAAHNNNGFVRYNERIFSWADQMRLAEAARRASSRGAHVIVSNASHADIERLYPEAELHTVTRWSGLPTVASKRGITQELVFFLRPPARFNRLVKDSFLSRQAHRARFF
jgi:DNA adenine methylase